MVTTIRNRWMGLLKGLSAAALAASLPAASWASGAGTTGAQFLEVGVDARGLAMGSAMAAVPDDTHAFYWNPAGVAGLNAPRVDASYNDLYQETSQGYFAFGMPVKGGGVIGASMDYLQVAGIEERLSDTPNPNYTFTSKDSAFALSYAHPNVLLSGLAFGANLKYIQSYLDTSNAHAFAVDLGAMYQKEDQPWSLGATLANFGTGLKYVNATEPLPLAVKWGGAYRLLDNKLLLAAAMDSWIRDSRTYEDLGLEYKAVRWVALRTGYQFGRGRDQLGGALVGYSVGVGFNFHGLNLDYAYVPFGDLGNTQRFSLGFRFGGSDEEDVRLKQH